MMTMPVRVDTPTLRLRALLRAISRTTTALTVLGTLLTVAHAAEADPAQTKIGLTLLIAPETTTVDSAQDVVVTYRLVNTGKAAVTVCNRPGFTLISGFKYPDGRVEGFDQHGTPTTNAGPVGPADLKTLRPNESIVGTETLHVNPTPVGYLRIYATYRSCTSSTNSSAPRLGAWKGEIRSKTIDIAVPRSSAE